MLGPRVLRPRRAPLRISGVVADGSAEYRRCSARRVTRGPILLLAVICTLWQCEWATVVSAYQPAARMSCACRGTEQCCCRMTQSPHQACHAAPTGHREQSAQCALRSDGCSHDAPMLADGVSREGRLPPSPSLPVILALQSIVWHDRTISPSVVLDLPFVPPKPSRSSTLS